MKRVLYPYFIALIFLLSKTANAQPCTPGDIPKLGPDTSVIVACYQDAIKLTSLYNTIGLTTNWSTTTPLSAKIGSYMLVATNASNCKDTAYITVKQDVKKWLGTVDSNWHNPANWSGNAVPNQYTHVYIFGESTYPCVISMADAAVASIRLVNGGTYKVINNRHLDVVASCDILPAYYEAYVKTIIIDNPTSQIIQSVDSSHVVFNGNTAQLQSLDTSNTIVCGIAKNAPYGFLRKIKKIDKAGTVYTITTDSTSLADAFKDIYFDYSKKFSINDTLKDPNLKTNSQQGAGGVSFHINMPNIKLAEGLTVNGGLEILPQFKFTMDDRHLIPRFARIEAGFERTLNLTLTAGKGVSFSKEIELYKVHLEPIPVTPFIVIFPSLRVSLGGAGSAGVSVSASYTNTSTVNAFVEYKNGNWSNGSTKQTEDGFNFSGINGDASVKVYVEPAIDFKLYDQDWVKGTISAQAFVKAEGVLLPEPNCTLSCGLEAAASVNLDFFGLEAGAEYSPDILKTEKELYKCKSDSTFTDPRDGQKYPYKTIGTQVWMTKNLNYAAAGSWCYDDNAANCDVYGRLYDWNTAIKVAPPGWHLPSDAEWTTLTDYLGGESIAGGAMKSTDLWASPNTGATNSSGFAGLPGGFGFNNGAFGGGGFGGYWWSSTENGTSYAWNRGLGYGYASAGRDGDDKADGFSVRCVRD